MIQAPVLRELGTRRSRRAGSRGRSSCSSGPRSRYFVLYASTRARTVTGEDSGELITAAYQLGVAHPPGYPLWVLLTKVFQTVFAGLNPADAAALSSSITTACAIGLLALVAFRLTRSIAASLFGAWSVGVGHEIWNHATIAEIYPLSLLLLAASLLLLLRWREDPDAETVLRARARLRLRARQPPDVPPLPAAVRHRRHRDAAAHPPGLAGDRAWTSRPRAAAPRVRPDLRRGGEPPVPLVGRRTNVPLGARALLTRDLHDRSSEDARERGEGPRAAPGNGVVRRRQPLACRPDRQRRRACAPRPS